ncbi:copper chaperone CCS1 [Aspergillus clavatus NRRL 1]|uniref:Superoxide dismutase 1 copper chaperone n=1 Tax=Aspergillus clavatus (strain ATCC 1007 / CBS 513.65 / DSM 816 / NCTC 3887 / NRRL 1 / QM 1276 / 107) TaxID=344612 RepID=A1C628_ASPCL|nr:superoxide dismutase copper chaperone Lys7, putative [Aspergillus clavatus NRRL 1]EAW13849.1 superoxide dismutase copper chaperone Lys7, putative [Aspergillus clavatus NRRL 1]
MTCESCVQDVSSSLYKLEGINKVEANLKDQLVFIEGTAPPSSIVNAIQATGRDAILRGSGTSNNPWGMIGSAVCIFETHSTAVPNKIRGLARMVQVSPTMTLVDLTVNGLAPGKYWATVREAGDISRGAESTGGIWEALKAKVTGGEAPKEPRGIFGSVDVDEKGRGNVFLDRPVAIWEMIGRSMVLSKSAEGPFRREDPDTLVGVIARSAGVWDNDKMVCSCSGKNVWQERQELVAQGMV